MAVKKTRKRATSAKRPKVASAKKHLYHYVAWIKGEEPTRFYHTSGEGTVAASAAHAFQGWTKSADMILTPSGRKGVYNAEWYDKYADRFRSTRFEILEQK